MSVKRFYWDTPSEYGHAEEHPEGELVWWTDYAKLEADYAALLAAKERLDKAIEEADEKLKLLAEWAVFSEINSAEINQVREIMRKVYVGKEGNANA